MYLGNANEMQNLILNEIIESQEICAILNQFVTTWVHFSLNEYQIYRKYNELTITLACILVTISLQEEAEIKIKLRNLVDELGIKEVEHCAQEISFLLKSQMGEANEINEVNVINDVNEEEKKSTRANSTTSLNDFFEQNVEICLKNDDNSNTKFIFTEEKENKIKNDLLGKKRSIKHINRKKSKKKQHKLIY